MKPTKFFILILLFLLSGCSNNILTETEKNNQQNLHQNENKENNFNDSQAEVINQTTDNIVDNNYQTPEPPKLKTEPIIDNTNKEIENRDTVPKTEPIIGDTIEEIENRDTISNNEKLLNLKNYLNKINQELVLLENDYNQLVNNINSENSIYKQEYDTNIKYVNDKYQEDINYYKPTHDYWVNYYQHQIDLEVGMGLRADKEEIKYYQNKLNLENTNYNNLISKLQNDKERKKSQYQLSYDNQLSNTTQRLNAITEVRNKGKIEREKLRAGILEEIRLLEK